MKAYDTPNLRNVAAAGQSGAGKSTLMDALLHSQRKLDRVLAEGGAPVSDYDPEEVRRGHSIASSLIPVEYKDVKVNFLDLPGNLDFAGSIKSGIQAADSVLICLDATHGVDPGSEFAAEWAAELGVKARAVFVNKMDKERADFAAAVRAAAEAFGVRAVPVVIPAGAEASFSGVIDLVRMKFVDERDRKAALTDIPAEWAEAAREARASLVEAAAEGDDDLMARFLDDQPLSEEEILRGLREGIAEGRVLPVLCGSALKTLGAAPLLSFIRDCMPSPLEGPGLECRAPEAGETTRMKPSEAGGTKLFVFKTVSDPYAGHLSFFKVARGTAKSETSLHNLNRGKSERLAHLLAVRGKKTENVDSLAAGDIGAVAKLEVTHTGDTLDERNHHGDGALFVPAPLPKPSLRMAVLPKGKSDPDKIALGLHRLEEQDPTLRHERDPEIHQTILSGLGEIHLDVAVHWLKTVSHVEVELEIPKIPYRETITGKAEGQGKHKKQSGGHGQYGDCWIRLEPLPEGSGFEFVWEIAGGVIPTKFAPSIEKGLAEAMRRGVLSGHPAVDIRAVCYDGSFHTVDSSDMAFKVAASLAFRNVAPQAGPVVLEPVMKARIAVPERAVGDVMGDLNSRRGRILGVEAAPDGRRRIVEALVPMASMFTYGRDLRSMTRGAGFFETEFHHYERTPAEVQDKIVAAAAAAGAHPPEE